MTASGVPNFPNLIDGVPDVYSPETFPQTPDANLPFLVYRGPPVHTAVDNPGYTDALSGSDPAITGP